MIILNLDVYLPGSKAVYAFHLSEEQDLEPLPLRIVIDIFGQLLINGISFDRYVDCNLGLKIQYVALQIFKLYLIIFELFQKLKRGLISLKHLLFKVL